MPAIPPKLTPEQRKAALEKAGQVRSRRAEIKKNLKQKELNFLDVIELSEKEEALAGFKVLSLLESVPGIGKVKARRKMAELGISEIRRLKGLSPKQKTALLGLFE